MKKNFKLFILIVLISGCKSKNSTSVQVEEFENRITQEGFFWQSEYGNTIDCLFLKSGDIFGVVNGDSSRKIQGKWSFDKTTRTLQIAWEGNHQYSVKVENINSEWTNIKLSDRIYNLGRSELVKMKLLDNRFE